VTPTPSMAAYATTSASGTSRRSTNGNSGSDALAAAQRVHTSNVLGLGVGQVHYGAFCDADGLMVDDGTVYRLDDRVWVMTNGSEHADHFAAATSGLDVEIEAITLTMPHLGLQGPRSREALTPLCEADISKLPYFRFLPEPTKVGASPVSCRGPASVENSGTSSSAVPSMRLTSGTSSCPR